MTAFLLDGMLEGLARRLRLVGYDCHMIGANVRGERDLRAQAHTENRLVLTVSAHRAAYAPGLFLLLPQAGIEDQLRAILTRYPIDFHRLAFTRCSIDNTILVDVPFESVASQLPPKVREHASEPIRRCPCCDRLYWAGTHTERLREYFDKLDINPD